MPAPVQFDRSKPFYPFVIHYICAIYGFKEIQALGLSKRLREATNEATTILSSEALQFFIELAIGNYKDKDTAILKTIVSHPPVEYLPPLQLRSLQTGDSVAISAEEIAVDILENHRYLLEFSTQAAGQLVIIAKEATAQYQDKGPLWEFLRHCRNAAAHGGRFQIRNSELNHLPNGDLTLKCPAKWGRFEITPSHNTTPLFEIPGSPGLLSFGDPIRLLWDIEQAYPAMGT